MQQLQSSRASSPTSVGTEHSASVKRTISRALQAQHAQHAQEEDAAGMPHKIYDDLEGINIAFPPSPLHSPPSPPSSLSSTPLFGAPPPNNRCLINVALIFIAAALQLPTTTTAATTTTLSAVVNQ
ncbi:unnamed protein product [Ceratitis capitata]|uniref:(Mediterranean fruit fly) hypothetical protein n=1 Tax=Ceratitis capitata TaxID=7213 RepID=A0A811UGE6_CERCA|nr:unnamed protein product [Ceratitis capitata]